MAFTNNNDQRAMMADINVTPLVDVMLVLLIIFMISAPMMTQGLDVNLPEVKTGPISDKGERIVITITSEGKVFLGDLPVPENNNIGLTVKRQMDLKKAKDVILRADKDVPYGYVAVTMGSLKEAGINAIGLVTEPEPVNKPGEKKKQS